MNKIRQCPFFDPEGKDQPWFSCSVHSSPSSQTMLRLFRSVFLTEYPTIYDKICEASSSFKSNLNYLWSLSHLILWSLNEVISPGSIWLHVLCKRNKCTAESFLFCLSFPSFLPSFFPSVLPFFSSQFIICNSSKNNSSFEWLVNIFISTMSVHITIHTQDHVLYNHVRDDFGVCD